MPMEARNRAPEPGGRAGDRFLLEGPARCGCDVWLALDQQGGRAALKFGPADRLAQEFRVLESITHPNIVRPLALVRATADCGPFIAFEYLPGGDLVSLIGEPAAYWLASMSDVADALTALHACGLIHRDLKARNVMFDAAGRARLIDFGSAVASGSAWTAAGTTPEAVDPARGTAPVSAADDTYALAALLHELLYGRPPGPNRPDTGADSAGLAGLVTESLYSNDHWTRPGLSLFATVIKSALAASRGTLSESGR